MRYFSVLLVLLLAGCTSTGNVPPTGTAFTLDDCPPFMNCVSSSSTVDRYAIEPIHLAQPLNPSSWEVIKAEALALPGASLNEARFGYADITCYSEFFHFPDYLEVLVDADKQRLNVRSQSLLGFYDMGVNRRRVEMLRSQLIERGVAVK
ncbi:DUF1499 domain-containing protein [Marinobacter litoralis]|uniref:DUF1499 domain-containing protein n=1 Tax=Marinobacter litoralis TaxID=187981 RepID=UPI0018ED4BBB|nr:DUF1499 domain-containing protein [Marinobacter litoralis]MBJ6138910.1 DUF1499 domain-containing protein [Marinobacter litoralis]